MIAFSDGTSIRLKITLSYFTLLNSRHLLSWISLSFTAKNARLHHVHDIRTIEKFKILANFYFVVLLDFRYHKLYFAFIIARY